MSVRTLILVTYDTTRQSEFSFWPTVGGTDMQCSGNWHGDKITRFHSPYKGFILKLRPAHLILRVISVCYLISQLGPASWPRPLPSLHSLAAVVVREARQECELWAPLPIPQHQTEIKTNDVKHKSPSLVSSGEESEIFSSQTEKLFYKFSVRRELKRLRGKVSSVRQKKIYLWKFNCQQKASDICSPACQTYSDGHRRGETLISWMNLSVRLGDMWSMFSLTLAVSNSERTHLQTVLHSSDDRRNARKNYWQFVYTVNLFLSKSSPSLFCGYQLLMFNDCVS